MTALPSSRGGRRPQELVGYAMPGGSAPRPGLPPARPADSGTPPAHMSGAGLPAPVTAGGAQHASQDPAWNARWGQGNWTPNPGNPGATPHEQLQNDMARVRTRNSYITAGAAVIGTVGLGAGNLYLNYRNSSPHHPTGGA